MKSQDKYLLEEFEKVFWLYISEELPKKEMSFWKRKIEENTELQVFLDDLVKIPRFYDTAEIEDIDEELFDIAINNAVSKGRRFSFTNFLRKVVYGNSEEISPSYKLAFGSLLIIVAVIIFLSTNNPNPVKDISNELFSWEGESISKTLSEIDDDLYLMKNKEIKENLQQRITLDPWDNEIDLIKKQIDQLENEILKRKK